MELEDIKRILEQADEETMGLEIKEKALEIVNLFNSVAMSQGISLRLNKKK